MAVDPRGLLVDDFTGGFTDDYVNAPLNQAEEVDNLLIEINRSLLMRNGSIVEDATNAPIIPAGQQRIGTLINYDQNDKIFYHSANKLYYRNPSAYTTLQGPVDSNDFFPTATEANYVSHSEWKKHIFLASDTFETPKKLYKDSGGTYQLRTAGMPALASDPTITPTASGSATFLYAFLYQYTYTAGEEEFQDFGPTKVIEVTNSDDPSSNQNDITGIPVLSNGATESYDTSSIKVFIYRTIDGGTTLYKIGEVTNGTTTFTDTFSDSSIQSNEVIYTEGDVLDNDPPPLAKFVHVVNNKGYYAYLKEGSEFLASDILESHPEDPDSVPATNRTVVRDDIRGLSSVQSIPMVFCRKHIYRIEGSYDELGRGGTSAIIINDTAGCISNHSIVQAKDFIFWAGNDKFYASDGYKVIPLSDHFNRRYKQMVETMSDTARIVGTYDETNERIYWALQTDSSNSDNDTIWVLDLRRGLNENMPFTSLSGMDSFSPTALVFFSKNLLRGDSRGYVFLHSEDYNTDPKVDTSVSPTLWEVQPIIYKYKGFATNFGTDLVRKWVTRILLTAVNKSNITIGINVINDDGKTIRSLTPIRYRKNFVWGDPEFEWGDPDFVWNAEGLIQELRRMKHGGLRCSYMQIEVTNGFGVVTNSDTLGLATVAAPGVDSSRTVTLNDTATFDWPENSVDYFIAFANDAYVREYLITARTADTLTFLDTGANAPTGSTAWVIRAYRKGEVLNLLSYTLFYALFSQSHSMFEAGQAGENA